MSRHTPSHHPQQQIVLHYHYHYYIDGPPPAQHSQHELRRVKSDQKTSLPHEHSATSQTGSSSSQQSWKRLLKPHLQSTSPTLPRSSDSASFLQPPSNLQPTSTPTPNRGSVSEFALHSPKSPLRRERSISNVASELQESSFHSETPSFFSPASGEQRREESAGTASLLAKSRFSKKRQVQILNAHRLRQLAEGNPRKETRETHSYRQQLLQEECRYLRERFLAHLSSRHGPKFAA